MLRISGALQVSVRHMTIPLFLGAKTDLSPRRRLLMVSRQDPLFGLTVLAGIAAVFKSYPTVGDHALFLSLFSLHSQIFECEFGDHSSLTRRKRRWITDNRYRQQICATRSCQRSRTRIVPCWLRPSTRSGSRRDQVTPTFSTQSRWSGR